MTDEHDRLRTINRYLGMESIENEKPLICEEISLITAFPNPFNSFAMVKVDLPESGYSDICLFNNRGEKVIHLFSGFLLSGNYMFTIDGSSLPSGIYRVSYNGEFHSSDCSLILVK